MIGKLSFVLVTGANALVGDQVPYPLPVVNLRVEEPAFGGVLDQIENREYHAHAARLAQLRRQLSAMHAASSNALRSSLGKIKKSTSFLERLNPGRVGSSVSGSAGAADDAAKSLGKLIAEVSRLNGGDAGAAPVAASYSKEESDVVKQLEEAAIISQDAKLAQAPEERKVLSEMRAALANSPTVVGKGQDVFSVARNVPSSFLEKFGGGAAIVAGQANPAGGNSVINIGWESYSPDVVENRRNFEEKRAENALMADLAARRVRAGHSLEKLAALQHM
jgi:hypothetical protein